MKPTDDNWARANELTSSVIARTEAAAAEARRLRASIGAQAYERMLSGDQVIADPRQRAAALTLALEFVAETARVNDVSLRGPNLPRYGTAARELRQNHHRLTMALKEADDDQQLE